MIELRIEKYTDEWERKWDDFVMHKALNGTFLQTKRFLNYHPKDRFLDASFLILKGNDTIVAVIPGNEKDGCFYSHMGSTFGGIIINKDFNNIEHVEKIFEILDSYFIEKNYKEVILKNTSDLFSQGSSELLEYFFYKNEYQTLDEISFYIDFERYKEDVISNFTASRRRDYKYSLKNELCFKKLEANEEVAQFHSILCDNLKKFDAKPVHSLEELIEFKDTRLKDIVEFYGVFHDNIMIAGSMVFKFDKKVFHTQYLAADQDYLKTFPMNFMDANLIMEAKRQGFENFSFGISTEEKGKVLNKNLAEFKEGFGTTYSLNKTFTKRYM